jgi:plasmid stabilization system protein ParE
LRLRLNEAAASDIAQARNWYADRSPEAADRFLDALALAFETIELFPGAAPLVEAEAHRFQLRRFPHGIY